MKFNKKKVFVSALAISLIAILSFSTLAWFKDSDFVENDFMITDSEQVTDPDDVFSINIYETAVDEDGNVLKDNAGNDLITETGNTYDNIAPGDVLKKDPTIVNTGLYDQWVRVKVTVTNASAWLALVNKYNLVLERDLFTEFDNDAWQSEGAATPDANDEITFTYYLKDVLPAGDSITMFTNVTIPSSFNQEDMASIKDFSLKLVAEACQVENTKDNAFDAFEFVGM